MIGKAMYNACKNEKPRYLTDCGRTAHGSEIEKKNTSAGSVTEPPETEQVPESDLTEIELGPIGKRGAAAALARLEAVEERSFARLPRVIPAEISGESGQGILSAGKRSLLRKAQKAFLRLSIGSTLEK
jgi:hypothetical protein